MENNILSLISEFGGIMSGIGTIISCIVAYKVYKLETVPQLTLDYDIRQETGKFDKEVCYTLEERENLGIGFNRSGESYNIYIKLKNPSNNPIINLKLDYEIEIFKKELEITSEDETEYKIGKYKKFKTEKNSIYIEYFSPNKEKEYYILATDVIQKCNINIKSVKRKEKILNHKIFNKKFTLVSFDIFDYVLISDSRMERQLLGIQS